MTKTERDGCPIYDLCIVGAGMIGCAAARYSSTNRSLKVCIVGPEEPMERTVVSGQEVFGAHYDEGRITRSADPDPLWALLAQRSIDGYKDLEKQSGITFYHEIGSLLVGTHGGDYVKSLERNIMDQNIESRHKILDTETLKIKFPYFSFSRNDVGFHETSTAGYINPRKQIMAQLIVAMNHGCDVIRDVVTGIVRASDQNKFHRIVTEKGKLIYARKVLLTTGTFTPLHNLLPNSIKLPFKPMPQTVSLVEVSKEDAHHLKDMPVVIYHGKGTEGWYGGYPRDTDGNMHFYMLPPMQYPDAPRSLYGNAFYEYSRGPDCNVHFYTLSPLLSYGKYYIKLGHSDSILKGPLKQSEIREWYCGTGDKAVEQHLFELVRSFCKGINFLSHHGDACVTMVTPSFHPYIDLITPTFGVAIGGNGRAGKSCDEIGRLAADLIFKSKWTHDIPKEHFEIKKYVPRSKL